MFRVCNNMSEDRAFLLKHCFYRHPLACAPLLTPIAHRLAHSQHKMEEIYELLEKKNAKEKNDVVFYKICYKEMDFAFPPF